MGKFLSGDVKQVRELVIEDEVNELYKMTGFRSDAR